MDLEDSQVADNEYESSAYMFTWSDTQWDKLLQQVREETIDETELLSNVSVVETKIA